MFCCSGLFTYQGNTERLFLNSMDIFHNSSQLVLQNLYDVDESLALDWKTADSDAAAQVGTLCDNSQMIGIWLSGLEFVFECGQNLIEI